MDDPLGILNNPGQEIDLTSDTPPDSWNPSLGAGSSPVLNFAGTEPLIQMPLDGAITLDRGLFYEDAWHTDAHTREITGEDEEALVRFDVNKPGGAMLYFDNLMGRTVEQIGTVRLADMNMGERQKLLRQLVLGDRESLLLAIVRATYGLEQTLENVTCPMCATLQNITLDLVGDFPMNHLEDPLQEAYPVKLTRDRFVEVRIPTGADLLAVMSTKEDQVTAERNTAMLDRVITRYSHPGTSARKMNIKDRRTVLQFLYDVQPGPRIGEVKTPCLSCESEFLLGLNMAWLLQIQ